MEGMSGTVKSGPQRPPVGTLPLPLSLLVVQNGDQPQEELGSTCRKRQRLLSSVFLNDCMEKRCPPTGSAAQYCDMSKNLTPNFLECLYILDESGWKSPNYNNYTLSFRAASTALDTQQN